MLEQSINIASIYSQSGKFQFLDSQDELTDFLDAIEEAKIQGYDF